MGRTILTVSAVVLLCVLAAMPGPVLAQKLHTASRWIVGENGRRVKLACVNWPSHLLPVLAEGLHRQPVDAISARIRSTGFNCVRFTWPVYLATNETIASRTVRQTFQELGLVDALAGIESNNPNFLDLSAIEAYKAVLTSLRNNKVMVIMDNHLSKPAWCCDNNDGNGFFGDKYFDPGLWMQGLHKMATLATGFDNVVAMSLRNELRGPRQNVDDWFKYMQQGAETVHAANPNVLVILSGLSYDTDLSFLQNRQVNVSFTKKIVFEMHWYAFSGASREWVKGNLNDVCARVSYKVVQTWGSLWRQGFPLFLSEVGINQGGTDENGNRYWTCFLATAAEIDLDFALWALEGSYYLRQGVEDMEETYGLLNRNWTGIRNSTFLERMKFIQSPYKGPRMKQTGWHKIMFHPLTGMCVTKPSHHSPLKLGPCEHSESWIYTPRRKLRLKNKRGHRYLLAGGLGKAATLGHRSSTWEMISATRMHIATTVGGHTTCLDVDGQNNLVENECKCLSSDNTCDPSSQWFRLVDSTRKWW